MECVADVRVLSAHIRLPIRELGVHERAGEGNRTTHDPWRQDQRRRVNQPRDDGRIDEDAGADDSAHHDHRRVEQSQATSKRTSLVDHAPAPTGCANTTTYPPGSRTTTSSIP